MTIIDNLDVESSITIIDNLEIESKTVDPCVVKRVYVDMSDPVPYKMIYVPLHIDIRGVLVGGEMLMAGIKWPDKKMTRQLKGFITNNEQETRPYYKYDSTAWVCSERTLKHYKTN